jgi:hypothetical protein
MAALYGQRMTMPTPHSSWRFWAINAHFVRLSNQIVLVIAAGGQGRLSKNGAIIDRTISLTCCRGGRCVSPSNKPTPPAFHIM